MTKRKAPRDIEKRRKDKPPEQPITRRQWWKLPLEIFLGLSTVGGFFVALLAFLPKLSVDASGSLRPRDPGGTVFFISNDGVLTLYDLEIRCRVDDIETADGLQLKGATFRFPLGSTAERLESGKKMTAPCQRAIEVTGSPAVRSAMTIIADYKPIKWWFRRREEFHVEAAKSQDGTWIWTHVPS